MFMSEMSEIIAIIADLIGEYWKFISGGIRH